LEIVAELGDELGGDVGIGDVVDRAEHLLSVNRP
jgi:hypothetical protein